MEGGFCYFIIVLIVLALVIFGLWELMSKKKSNESDADVQFRQLRAFGYLIISQIVLIVGGALCFSISGGPARVSSFFGRGMRSPIA